MSDSTSVNIFDNYIIDNNQKTLTICRYRHDVQMHKYLLLPSLSDVYRISFLSCQVLENQKTQCKLVLHFQTQSKTIGNRWMNT